MRSARRTEIRHPTGPAAQPRPRRARLSSFCSLRAEFSLIAKPFTNLKVAQRALDEWVDDYNQRRPRSR